MKNPEYHGIEEYVAALETALGRPNAQSRDIVDEVRADLNVRVEQLQSDGLPHPDAVQQALGDLGNPYELAHGMKQEIPPFSGDLIRGIRYAAAGGLTLWLVVLLWLLRGWSYGVSGLTVTLAILFMHLPVILLLWPRIVWRRNWLFGLIPAGIAFAVALVLNLGGVESSQEISGVLPQTEEEVAALNRQLEQQAAAGMDSPRPFPIAILSTAGIVTFILLMAVQRKVQRRVVVLAALLLVALVEIPFQVEEMLFRRDVEKIHTYLEAGRSPDGAYPAADEFDAHGPELTSRNPGLSVTGQQFSLFWTRPLSSGFAIRYSSDDGRISIQD